MAHPKLQDVRQAAAEDGVVVEHTPLELAGQRW